MGLMSGSTHISDDTKIRRDGRRWWRRGSACRHVVAEPRRSQGTGAAAVRAFLMLEGRLLCRRTQMISRGRIMMLRARLHDVSISTTSTLDDDVADKLAAERVDRPAFQAGGDEALRSGLEASAEIERPPHLVQRWTWGQRTGVELDDIWGLIDRLDAPEISDRRRRQHRDLRSRFQQCEARASTAMVRGAAEYRSGRPVWPCYVDGVWRGLRPIRGSTSGHFRRQRPPTSSRVGLPGTT